MRRAWLIVFLVLFADQALKVWVKLHFFYDGSISILGDKGFLHFIENRGMAFGMEAAMLGWLGGVAGLAMGWVGAQGAVQLVGRTVNALYHSSSADAAALHGTEAILALVASVATCLLAGWMPAAAASAIPPAQVMARSLGIRSEGRSIGRRSITAGILVAIGVGGCGSPPIRLEGGGRFSPWLRLPF